MMNFNKPKTIKPDASQANSKKPMHILKWIDYGNGDPVKSDEHYAKIEADAKAVYERKNPRPKVEPTIEQADFGAVKNFDKPKKRVDNWSLIKATAKSPGEIADIRQIVNEDYKKHGIKHIAPEDKKYLDKLTEDKPFTNDPYLEGILGEDWYL